MDARASDTAPPAAGSQRTGEPGTLTRLGRRVWGGAKRFLKAAFNFDRVLGYALLAALFVVYAWNPYPVEFLRLKTFDMYQRVKPRPIPPPEKKPVTIIDLDEASLSEIGQWPWPRNTIAQLVQNLFQMGAVVVAFDMVFAEPDRMNPKDIAKALAGIDDETRDKLAKLKGNDEVFAEVIKKTRVVLGQVGYWEQLNTQKGPPVKKSVAERKLTKNPAPPLQLHLPNFPSLVRNIPVLEQAAANPNGGHGIFSLEPEIDGIIRRVPLLFAYDGHVFPALSIEMLRVAFQRQTTLANYNELGMVSVGVTPQFIIPTDARGRTWLYFSRSDKAKYVPAKDVLAGTAKSELIKGKLTILGTSAVGLLDIRAVPTEPIIPGVEVHAQLIEVAANQAYLFRPAYMDGAELMLILVGGLLMIVLVPWVGAKWTVLLFLAIASGAGATSWFLFAGIDIGPLPLVGGFKFDGRLLFDAGFAIISILFLYTVLTYMSYAREETQRRQTRDAFSKYLSPDMVARVAANPGELKLGGEQRDMTLLFLDVRGFTTISEQFTPVGLTGLINKLLTPLTDKILEHLGTVDKYMGDAIMSFWNAPLDDPKHARHACTAAMEMMKLMEPLNVKLEAEAIADGRKHVPLKIGIGVNSGPAVVGNMGSEQRFDYSCLGDTVNTASRLEGQSKAYGVNIVIGPVTRSSVPEFATLELDRLQVKGKTQALQIFTLLGDETMRQDPGFAKLEQTHDEMIKVYRAQKWDEAKQKMAICRKLCLPFYDMGGFYDLYEERIEEYKVNPLAADWNGVYVATSK